MRSNWVVRSEILIFLNCLRFVLVVAVGLGIAFTYISSASARVLPGLGFNRVWEIRCVRTKPKQLDGVGLMGALIGASWIYKARAIAIGYVYIKTESGERERDTHRDVYKLYPKWFGTRFEAHGTNVRLNANGRRQRRMGGREDGWTDGLTSTCLSIHW